MTNDAAAAAAAADDDDGSIAAGWILPGRIKWHVNEISITRR